MNKTNSLDKATDKISTKTAGLLFGLPGLIVIAAVLLWAAWNGWIIIAVITGLAIAAAGLSRLWSYLALKNLRGECSWSDLRGFPGDTVELKLRLLNRKILPLPWAEISEEIPVGLLIDDKAAPSDRAGFERIVRSSPVLWYSAISWKSHLSCRRRGYYPLGPLYITTGDIFGFYPRTMIEQVEDHLIVYPRIFNIDHLSISAAYPLGEAMAETSLYEDPSRVTGVRDYCPGDSLRRIHWKASARRQQLQVKVYESTATLKVVLFLVVDSYQLQGVNLEEELETGISTAASLANFCVEKKSQVGFWTDSRMADSGLPARIPSASGVECLLNILEALAKVTPVSHQSFPAFFQSERSHLPHGATLVFIFSRIYPDLLTILAEARSSGYKILALQTGDAVDSGMPGIPWYKVGSSGQIVALRTGDLHAVR